MDKKIRAIQIIEGLYPPDSEYPESAEIGKRLLEQAKQEVQGWRTESEEVLTRFAQLCISEEERSTREFLRKHRR
jgi:hypothetical protein